ncbi:WD40 repeat domain-containing protein [Aeromonas schubertii]|uniref:Vegetatible incompatibility protein HET-E-1 n=2 Tax=Aeromonas TaxID=642 RepID=A0ABS7VD67_9GAMM|nr:hypothetical protein [Aeromonas schubertii]KUE81078.1 hypothetical protein ATO46_13510 [Aeromonas schubertii]MBZ6067329.1 hypothetical protein [Aeromonas schubertii]MBZ6070808.1 hypothetical protein [Aeromonas schubertii]QCG47219.1 hypothetical protein E2P79_04525 [Aeromonas schubertii]
MQKSAILFLLCPLLLYGCDKNAVQPQQTRELSYQGALTADLSADSHTALVSTAQQMTVWDLKEDRQRYRWEMPSPDGNLVFVTRFSPAASHAVTATPTTFSLWSLADGHSVGFYSLPESRLRDITLSESGRFVLIGREDGKAEFVDLTTGRRLQFLGHSEQVNTVDLSANGRYALTGGNDYTAYLWDTQSGQVIHRFNHGSRVTLVRLDPRGRYAFTASSMGQARIWELVSGKEVSRLQMKHRQEIYSAARFVNDGQWLLTGSPSRQANLWRVSDGAPLDEWLVTPREGPRPSSAVVYGVALGDNSRVVTVSSSGLAETWSLK